MKTYLQLLYKSFYDISFVRDFIKNGKGTGIGLLALLALIVSLVTTIAFTYQIRVLYDTNKVSSVAYEISNKVPKFIIADGELQWEDGMYETYMLSDFADAETMAGEEDMRVLVIDTTNPFPSITNIKSSLFYLTKTHLYVNNEGGETRSISLEQLQKASGQDPLDLTSVENINHMIKFVQGFMTVVIFFLFVFIFLLDWVINIILAIITRFFAKLINKSLQDVEFSEIRRAAAVAILPVLLLVAISRVTFGAPGAIVKWLVVVVVGIILLNKFIPANTKTKQEVTKS